MQLWNDYEGTTLAGQWKLGALLRTEGRSALFATTRADGGAAVLRLTEALNDQAVLQARYRLIQAAGDQFLVKVEGYGEAELDGSPLSYAVLEPTQESLADILSQRSLGVDETHEVAWAVAGGLMALHGQGLVHGLVAPESVLAAGERIKLRSDCARPAAAPEDAMLEGALTPETDALGLAGVIFQALTRNRLQDASDALALPEPFASIVRNTVRQAWGVAEIQAELERSRRAATPVLSPVVAAAPPVAPSAASVAGVSAAGSATVAVADGRAPLRQELPLSARGVSSGVAGEDDAGSDWQKPVPMDTVRRRGILIAVAAVVVAVLLFAGLHHTGSGHGSGAGDKHTAAMEPSTMVAPLPAPAPAAKRIAAPGRQEAATAAASAATAVGPSLASGSKAWRVIAYTYDRRVEAEAKATSLNRRFPGFDAQAWSRTGSRPFLVTLGGPMPKADAFAMRAKARHAGIARDVYAQNYKE